jgi:hypothetical protein
MITSAPILFLLLTFVPAPLPSAGQARADCVTWQDCRDQALAAHAAGESERFHDLAWLAVRKGPKNAPDLLVLLARAQSVSGRPHDALVMLGRIAGMGVRVADVESSDDFRRVRDLSGWADLQARMSAAATPEPSTAAAEKPTGKPASAVSPKPEPAPKPAAPPATTSAPAKPDPAPKEEAAVGEATDALRFSALPFRPSGLAYDAVSKRFVVGNRGEHKIAVIGEQSQNLLTLASADGAGFGEIEALAIDVRQGDLWVASSAGDPRRSRLHKLQLISGRQLTTIDAPDDAGRLTDLVVTARGDLLALDSTGNRIFRLPARGKQIEPAVAVDKHNLAAIAADGNGSVFAATPDGVVAIDLGRRVTAPLTASNGVSLAGIQALRWHAGTLVAVQQTPDGLQRVVRIHLNSGGLRATRLDVLEKGLKLASPASIVVADDTLFYVTAGDGDREVVIRKIRLRR